MFYRIQLFIIRLNLSIFADKLPINL